MSSYGQHAPSSSFQQDSALVAQYASQVYSERDPRSCSHSDVPEEIAAWNDTTLYESRPKRLTIGLPVHKTEPPNSPDERSPLLRKPSVSRIDESHESVDDRLSHDFDYKRLVFDEVKTLARYTLPVFGYPSPLSFGYHRSHSLSQMLTVHIFWRYGRLSISMHLF